MTALRVALVFAVLLLGACKSEEEKAPEAAPAEPEVAKAPEAEAKPEVPMIFDAHGALLPSDDYVVGVRLPRGSELSLDQPTVHVYRVLAPVDRVLTYFGPLLITGRVERQGKGAVYRNASVRGAETSPTKVNVSILEGGGGYTRIAISEIRPSPEFAPSQEETLKRARQEFRRLD